MELELETPFMKAHVADGIGWMTFNNPDRRNAMKLEMNHAVVQIYITNCVWLNWAVQGNAPVPSAPLKMALSVPRG